MLIIIFTFRIDSLERNIIAVWRLPNKEAMDGDNLGRGAVVLFPLGLAIGPLSPMWTGWCRVEFPKPYPIFLFDLYSNHCMTSDECVLVPKAALPRWKAMQLLHQEQKSWIRFTRSKLRGGDLQRSHGLSPELNHGKGALGFWKPSSGIMTR